MEHQPHEDSLPAGQCKQQRNNEVNTESNRWEQNPPKGRTKWKGQPTRDITRQHTQNAQPWKLPFRRLQACRRLEGRTEQDQNLKQEDTEGELREIRTLRPPLRCRYGGGPWIYISPPIQPFQDGGYKREVVLTYEEYIVQSFIKVQTKSGVGRRGLWFAWGRIQLPRKRSGAMQKRLCRIGPDKEDLRFEYHYGEDGMECDFVGNRGIQKIWTRNNLKDLCIQDGMILWFMTDPVRGVCATIKQAIARVHNTINKLKYAMHDLDIRVRYVAMESRAVERLIEPKPDIRHGQNHYTAVSSSTHDTVSCY